jgi:hypothetical protein
MTLSAAEDAGFQTATDVWLRATMGQAHGAACGGASIPKPEDIEHDHSSEPDPAESRPRHADGKE